MRFAQEIGKEMWGGGDEGGVRGQAQEFFPNSGPVPELPPHLSFPTVFLRLRNEQLDFDSAVIPPALGGLVIRDGLGLAGTLGFDPAGGDVLLIHQISLHSFCPAQAGPFIDFLAPLIVCVPGQYSPQLRILPHLEGNLIQLGFGLVIGANRFDLHDNLFAHRERLGGAGAGAAIILNCYGNTVPAS